MGHEKKKRKKERDRDGDRKRHRYESEEKDGITDESSRSHRRKHKKHKERGHKRRHSSGSPDNGVERAASPVSDHESPPDHRSLNSRYSPVNQEKFPVNIEPETIDSSAVTSAGGESSLSIEETNKLRASLGLKPLDVDGEAKSGVTAENDDESKPKLGSSDTYAIHKRPENIGVKKKAEEMREKLSSRRKQREIESKLLRSGGLGAADDHEDDSASAWVNKSRKITHEKEMAAKRAAMLDDLDAEFGVGSLVDEDVKISASAAYSSADLVGLTIAHNVDRINEGREVVLTLEDRGVLDESTGDVLVNVNMIDDERHEKNVTIRKTKLGYQPDDGNEWDEEGNYVQKSILSQYDEELEGPKRSSFVIGHSQEARTSAASRSELNSHTSNAIDDMKRKLRDKVSQSLQLAAPKIASDFFTEQEMTSFKKVKKKVRKVRKKAKSLKADDLLPLADNVSQHLGRRGDKNGGVQCKVEPSGEESDNDPISAETDDTVPVEDLTGVKLEAGDDSDVHVNYAIERARRLQELGSVKLEKDAVSMEENLANLIVKTEPPDESMDDPAPESSANIVLNTTAEFCRTLGDIPTYGLAGNRSDGVENLSEIGRDLSSDKNLSEEGSAGGAWSEIVTNSAAESTSDGDRQETSVILDEEPEVGSGLAGALKLAMKKGYVDKDPGRKGVSQQVLSHLRAQNYSIDDKSGVDEDRGRRGRGSSFYSGPSSEFNEKKNYKPDIQLEYADDQGRLLCPKEAFRYLSHKFHGKGSGKIKTEKREKRFREERLMAQMNSSDTPLNTLSRLQEKQKQMQSPFVVLSGNSLLNSDASSSQVSKR